MGLISQSEFLSFNDVIDILILSNLLIRACFFARLGNLGLNFGGKPGMIDKELAGINLRDRVDGDIGCLMFETTMDIDVFFNAPNSGTEALNSSELVPL